MHCTLLVIGDDPGGQLALHVFDERLPASEQPLAQMDSWEVGGRWSPFFVALDGTRSDSLRKDEVDWDATGVRASGEARTSTAVRTHAILKGGAWLEADGYGEDDDPSWPDRWAEALAGVGDDALLTLIDYHV